MDDKQGVSMIIRLDAEESKVVSAAKKHYGLVSKEIAVRKIIREHGSLKEISFGS